MKVARYFGKPSFNPHTSMKRAAALTSILGAVLLTGAAPALAQQNVGGVDIFPASNIWNMKIDTLPVDKNSNSYVNALGATGRVHPDWGTNPAYGIPYNVVTGPVTQTMDFSPGYPDECDPGPYPTVTTGLKIEGNDWSAANDGDRHVLMVNTTNGVLYELYNTSAPPPQAWAGAVYPLSSNALRPEGWTSADAAGLPIFPALVNYPETAAGPIKHAFRFTGHRANGHIWPARHSAGSATPGAPPFGQRFRLKKSFNINAFTTDPLIRRILTALKEYGMFYADYGSNWYITGAPHPSWDDNAVDQLKQLKGSDFEAVDESAYMITPDSAIAGLRKPAPKPVPTPGKPWPKFK
ncbi:MAG: hypothetical protein JSS83_12395 [Cyanobacteria bacterium SZAS LIN-3]|nr:hypothetical protein [Cyanobacteria bacterium SZAS LIN-3]